VCRGEAFLTHAGTERCRSRDDDREEIRHRRTRDEDSARRLREREHLPGPFDDLALDLDRNVIAAAEVRIESSGEHLRQHAHDVAAAVHPPHEPRMHVARGVRQHVLREFSVDIRQLGRRARQRGTESRAHLVGDGLPHRTLADVLDVVEHVVEHDVRLPAHGGPIVGVQRRAAGGLSKIVHGNQDTAGVDCARRASCAAVTSRATATAPSSAPVAERTTAKLISTYNRPPVL
jgi:hypothetical protein